MKVITVCFFAKQAGKNTFEMGLSVLRPAQEEGSHRVLRGGTPVAMGPHEKEFFPVVFQCINADTLTPDPSPIAEKRDGRGEPQ